MGLIAAVLAALFLGFLASKGYGLPLIAVVLLCLAFLWVVWRLVVLPAIMLGAMMLPTSGMSSTQTHGIPVVTALGAITLITTLLVWQWQKRNRGGTSA